VNLAGDALNWAPAERPRVYFWPRFSFPGTGHREPDAAIAADQENGGRMALVVEVKYRSGLSNISAADDDAAENDEQFRFGKQLADEYCGIRCGEWWSEEFRDLLAAMKGDSYSL